MRHFNKLLSICIILLAAGACGAGPVRQGKPPRFKPAIMDYLEKEFPDWKLVGVDDLVDYHKDFWLKEHSADCPGLASGHYEPTGRWSNAVLIIPKSPTDHRAQLILLRYDHGSYRRKILASIKERGATPVVFRGPPGRYRSWDGSRRIRTGYAVVSLVSYESSATIFFWARGKFHELQVSD